MSKHAEIEPRAGGVRMAAALVSLVLLSLAALCVAMMVGSARMPLSQFVEAVRDRLFAGSGAAAASAGTRDLIIWGIRLPRALMAYCVGASLSISGVAMQGVFKNPMAEPHIMGVSSGAALGAAVAMIFVRGTGLVGLSVVSLGALVGGIGAAMLVMLLSGRATGSVTNLLLSGVAVGTFLTAMLSGLLSLNHDKMEAVYTWTMGSFATATMTKVSMLSPLLVLCLLVMRVFARDLNAMLLGEDEARSLGIRAFRTRILLLLVATLLTAVAVSMSGIIGFVGLMVPHAVRMLVGPDHRRVIPVSFLSGGLFLMVMDTLARTVFMPTELPVGVLTALVGGPFFLILLQRSRRRIGGGL